MTSLFDDFDDDVYADDETAASDDFGFDDEFDQLRTASSGDDEYGSAVTDSGGSGGGLAATLSAFSPSQRLILALLLVLDIFAIGIALLLWTGVI